jgi:hypothetical protein
VRGLWVNHSFDIGMPVDATSVSFIFLISIFLFLMLLLFSFVLSHIKLLDVYDLVFVQ